MRNQGGFGGEREMHDATCSACGKTTKVPFKPDPNREVFCQDCFKERKPRREH